MKRLRTEAVRPRLLLSISPKGSPHYGPQQPVCQEQSWRAEDGETARVSAELGTGPISIFMTYNNMLGRTVRGQTGRPTTKRGGKSITGNTSGNIVDFESEAFWGT